MQVEGRVEPDTAPSNFSGMRLTRHGCGPAAALPQVQKDMSLRCSLRQAVYLIYQFKKVFLHDQSAHWRLSALLSEIRSNSASLHG